MKNMDKITTSIIMGLEHNLIKNKPQKCIYFVTDMLTFKIKSAPNIHLW